MDRRFIMTVQEYYSLVEKAGKVLIMDMKDTVII